MPLFKTYLTSNLTTYALMRIKYLAARAFKFFTVTKKEGKSGNPIGKTYLIERKDAVRLSNSSEEQEEITSEY